MSGHRVLGPLFDLDCGFLQGHTWVAVQLSGEACVGVVHPLSAAVTHTEKKHDFSSHKMAYHKHSQKGQLEILLHIYQRHHG